MGSIKGWAGLFLFNEKAKTSLYNFLDKENTLLVGICKGCQLLMELEKINPVHKIYKKMIHNKSHKKGKCFLHG